MVKFSLEDSVRNENYLYKSEAETEGVWEQLRKVKTTNLEAIIRTNTAGTG